MYAWNKIEIFNVAGCITKCVKHPAVRGAVLAMLWNDKQTQGPGKGLLLLVFSCGGGVTERNFAERGLCETCAVKGAIKCRRICLDVSEKKTLVSTSLCSATTRFDKGPAKAFLFLSSSAAAGLLRRASLKESSARHAPSREQSNDEILCLDVPKIIL